MCTALGLLAREGLTVLCDGMSDAFLNEYAAWPIRFYGARADSHAGLRLELIAQPCGAVFELPPLRDWLLRACAAVDACAGPGAGV